MNTKSRKIDWRHHVAKQHTSGFSIAEYCKRSGISSWSFYYHRKLFDAPQQINHQKPVAIESVSFKPLGSLPMRGGMRICFPNGIRVECDGTHGMDALSCVLSILQTSADEAHPC